MTEMKKHYAMKGRELVLRADGADLTAADLDVLADACGSLDRFAEASSEIEALAIKNIENLPEGYRREPIRGYFAVREVGDIGQCSRAKALMEWRQLTKFCGRCGAPLKDHGTQTARVCPECGNMIFPRIEPCIIVLVYRDGKILLAKHVQRNQDIYACIAGFIEGGETPEHAVERELQEEIGIRVKNIRYRGSQSWPFPDQLMLGYTADYESGEIRLQKDEIADADWFSRDNCPASPQPGSIAYRLIHTIY